MRKLRFAGGELRRVLCVGAHCDDIEIGCGATMLRLLRENPGLHVTWVVLSSTAQRRREALLSAKLFLGEAKGKRIQIRNFRDSYFPYQGGKIKDYINTLKAEPAPDLIFTHWRGDLHQDHRLVSELTWNAFRDHLICEYEIPKYDGDLGQPNLFVEVSEAFMSQKLIYFSVVQESNQQSMVYARHVSRIDADSRHGIGCDVEVCRGIPLPKDIGLIPLPEEP